VLVDARLGFRDATGRGLNHEITAGVQPQAVRALDATYDPLRFTAGLDHEVVLELASCPVIDEVDPRIDIPISHLGVRGDGGTPQGRVAADEVVDLLHKLLLSGHARSRVGADQLQT